MKEGSTTFTTCPHYTLPLTPDSTTRFITLLDTPGRVVIMALCGVCCNVVKGYFVADIAKGLIDEVLPKFVGSFQPTPSSAMPPVVRCDSEPFGMRVEYPVENIPKEQDVNKAFLPPSEIEGRSIGEQLLTLMRSYDDLAHDDEPSKDSTTKGDDYVPPIFPKFKGILATYQPIPTEPSNDSSQSET